MSIPKIMHQLWIGPHPPPQKELDSWREQHPDWEYMFWDETALKTHFPDGLHNQAQFDAISEWNGKCDIARYEILHKFGGFFIDADSLCLRPLDDYLLEVESFSCYENELVRGNLIAAGYLAVEKGSPLTAALIERLHLLRIGRKRWWHFGYTAWKTVGPGFLTKTVHAVKYTNLTVYPSHYFIPRHYTGLEYTGLFKPYCIHFWGSTPDTDYGYQ